MIPLSLKCKCILSTVTEYSFMYQEEECRKEGGKYAHLNDELHVYIEVFAEIADAYTRLSHAVAELKKFLVPVMI